MSEAEGDVQEHREADEKELEQNPVVPQRRGEHEQGIPGLHGD